MTASVMMSEAATHTMPYEDLPQVYRAALDRMAIDLVDPSSPRGVVVAGDPSSGKTFLIGLLSSNADRWCTPAGEVLEVLPLPDDGDVEIAPHGGRMVCYATDNMDAAREVWENSGHRVRLVVEVNTQQYNTVEEGRWPRRWSSWRLVDMSDLLLNRKTLVDFLSLSAHDLVMDSCGSDIDRGTVSKIVGKFVATNPDLVVDIPGSRKVICLPPAFWAEIIRRVVTLQHMQGATFSSVMATELSDTRELVSAYIDYQDPDREDDSPFGVLLRASITDDDDDAEGAVTKTPADMSGRNATFSSTSTLPSRLSERIVGQDAAVAAVCKGLLIPAVGLGNHSRPLRSMLFLGPTGVGKTQLALTVADQLMVEPMHVVRIDMSEFSSEHQVSRLFGAPPGYVGFSQGGILTTQVTSHPWSVVLLDEVEKAHPDVWSAFLQVLDAGRMTDGKGQEVDFTHTVVVMTSNVGARDLTGAPLGFSAGDMSARDASARAAMRDTFPPEFINRIDDVVTFSALSPDSLAAICRAEIADVSSRVRSEWGIVLSEPDDDVVQAVIRGSQVDRYGAREVQRRVSETVSVPVAQCMFGRDIARVEPGSRTCQGVVSLSVDGDGSVAVQWEENGGLS